MSQFVMLIGKTMPMSDLENANPILARLFAFAFLAFGSLMLVNLFITMIMGYIAKQRVLIEIANGLSCGIL